MENSIKNVVTIEYLTSENAAFYRTGDFIGLKTTDADGTEHDHGRVFVHRLFPYTELTTNISVMNNEQEEIGIIADVDAFGDENAAELIKAELDVKYFIPKINAILMLKEKFGFSNWKVRTDAGTVSFTVRDTYRSIIRIGESRMYVIDNDGNRYEIEDFNKLDRKSFKKIELYI